MSRVPALATFYKQQIKRINAHLAKIQIKIGVLQHEEQLLIEQKVTAEKWLAENAAKNESETPA